MKKLSKIMDWEKYAFVACGKNRKKLLLCLDTPLMPTEIAEITGESLSHVSHTLKALAKEGLVECLNPHKKVGKVFHRTKQGNKITNYIRVKNYIKLESYKH